MADVRLLAEGLGQVLGDVLGGGDEPAEDDRVVAVGEQRLDLVDERRELGVLRRTLDRGEGRRQLLEPPGLRRRLVVLGKTTGRRVDALQGLLVGEVEHAGAPQLVGLPVGLGADGGRSGDERGGGGPRGGGDGAQHREGRPPGHPLPQPAARLADRLAGVVEDLAGEPAVLAGQRVGDVANVPVLREGRLLVVGGVLAEELADVAAAALYEVPGQLLAAFHALQVDVAQLGVEQGDEVTEGVLFTTVRSGGDQDEVPFGVALAICSSSR